MFTHISYAFVVLLSKQASFTEKKQKFFSTFIIRNASINISTILDKRVGIHGEILKNPAPPSPPSFNVVFIFQLSRIFCWIIENIFYGYLYV